MEADFFGLSGLQEILSQRRAQAQDDFPDWMKELEVVDKKQLRIFQLAQASFYKDFVQNLRPMSQSIKSPATAAFLEATKKLQERKTDILKNGPNNA